MRENPQSLDDLIGPLLDSHQLSPHLSCTGEHRSDFFFPIFYKNSYELVEFKVSLRRFRSNSLLFCPMHALFGLYEALILPWSREQILPD